MKLLYSDALLDLLVKRKIITGEQRTFVSLEKGKQRQKLLKQHGGNDPLDRNYPDLIDIVVSFNLQKAVSTTIRNHEQDYWTGTVYTTNRRVWEHDKDFKAYLRRIRAMAIDMETATLFSTGFYNEIPTGALLLVSDQPMIPEGVKTAASDQKVTQDYLDMHLQIGIDSLKELINHGLTVKHLYF